MRVLGRAVASVGVITPGGLGVTPPPAPAGGVEVWAEAGDCRFSNGSAVTLGDALPPTVTTKLRVDPAAPYMGAPVRHVTGWRVSLTKSAGGTAVLGALVSCLGQELCVSPRTGWATHPSLRGDALVLAAFLDALGRVDGAPLPAVRGSAPGTHWCSPDLRAAPAPPGAPYVWTGTLSYRGWVPQVDTHPAAPALAPIDYAPAGPTKGAASRTGRRKKFLYIIMGESWRDTTRAAREAQSDK